MVWRMLQQQQQQWRQVAVDMVQALVADSSNNRRRLNYLRCLKKQLARRGTVR